MCCEAIPRRVNYLNDDAVDIGKGANSIISMLHFFGVHGLGDENVHLMWTTVGVKISTML